MSLNASEGTNVESSSDSEPLVKSGSTSDTTSFDELEELVTPTKPQRKAIDNAEPKKQPKEAPKEAKASKKAEKGEDDGSEENSEEGDDSKKEDSSEGDPKEKPNQEKSQKGKLDPKPKVIKATKGDQSFDLPSDATFEVIIDGQKQTVSTQDLLNNYSGKTNFGKKYQELDTERKAFETSRAELDSGINTWVDLTKSDPVAAIEYACEISGVDSRQMIQSIRNQFKQAFEEYTLLTPEERKERELVDERDYYKSKTEKTEADRAKQRQSAELDKRVKSTIEKYQLDNTSYVSSYEDLKVLQAKGIFTGEITPELVGEYHQQNSKQKVVTTILNEKCPDLEDKTSAYKLLADLWSTDPSLSADDIGKIAAEVYGSDAAKRLGKKVKKSFASQQEAPKRTMNLNEPLFFDDLDY